MTYEKHFRCAVRKALIEALSVAKTKISDLQTDVATSALFRSLHAKDLAIVPRDPSRVMVDASRNALAQQTELNGAWVPAYKKHRIRLSAAINAAPHCLEYPSNLSCQYKRDGEKCEDSSPD